MLSGGDRYNLYILGYILMLYLIQQSRMKAWIG